MQHKRFAKATGVAPITLIDDDGPIGGLVEFGIGVRKPTVELLEVDRAISVEASEVRIRPSPRHA